MWQIFTMASCKCKKYIYTLQQDKCKCKKFGHVIYTYTGFTCHIYGYWHLHAQYWSEPIDLPSKTGAMYV
jgi:hypothetical protein